MVIGSLRLLDLLLRVVDHSKREREREKERERERERERQGVY